MLTEEQIYYEDLFSKLSAYALLVAIIPIWPYFYYQLLKFLVFGTAAYIAYLSYKNQNKRWMWGMIIVAIIFNPINPLYFGHPLWSIIDLVVAILFFKTKNLAN